MFQSVTRGIALVLLAPVSAISALVRFRKQEKTAADRILEKRGLKAADVYSSRLDSRMNEEEQCIELQERLEA